ncbi:hypothetical protein TIFTF001_018113 [Ficus carica]|uniref:C2H2-type domain-containing protein n=1 Tax=Ficus carica TaxID=3494 RepID=A0AA88DBD2_FICCA|nr:hypothetical protein TIFTF001_018113 [Ficus carica]
MERSNLSAIGKIIKEKWNCTDLIGSDHNGHSCDLPWAVKNYACSFCKRQFKSAQALGGHMNVHRRERARLRLFPPNLSLSESCPNLQNPNPNYNFSSLSSSSATLSAANNKLLPHHYTPHSMLCPPLASLSLPDPLASSTEKDMKAIFDFPPGNTTVPFIGTPQGKAAAFEDGDLKWFSPKDDYFKTLKTEKSNFIRLELEMGLLKDRKEDVDLELRLGYF